MQLIRKGYFELCTLKKPHGVRGKIKAATNLQGNIDLHSLDTALLVPNNGADREINILHIAVSPKGLILTIEAIDTFEAAAELFGAKIYVNSDLLDELDEGEFYWQDLIGAEVFETDGTCVGILKDVIERGEQDLMVVMDGEVEILIPAAEELFEDIDIDAKKITMHLPEGLKDIQNGKP